jgi:hypothetical protein
MKITDYIDLDAVQKKLSEIQDERTQLKRRQATLRVQAHRLRKFLQNKD